MSLLFCQFVADGCCCAVVYLTPALSASRARCLSLLAPTRTASHHRIPFSLRCWWCCFLVVSHPTLMCSLRLHSFICRSHASRSFVTERASFLVHLFWVHFFGCCFACFGLSQFFFPVALCCPALLSLSSLLFSVSSSHLLSVSLPLCLICFLVRVPPFDGV